MPSGSTRPPAIPHAVSPGAVSLRRRARPYDRFPNSPESQETKTFHNRGSARSSSPCATAGAVDGVGTRAATGLAVPAVLGAGGVSGGAPNAS